MPPDSKRNTSDFPILLMPVKVETRFVYNEWVKIKNENGVWEYGNRVDLWIRIFPDEVFLHSFNPLLSIEERADRDAFDGSLGNWQELVSRYGTYRASWLVQAPEDEIGEAGTETGEGTDFRYKWLPDYFEVYLYWNEEGKERSKSHRLNNIEPGDLNLFDEQDDWMSDFNAAFDRGMAGKIPFQTYPLEAPHPECKIERIIAVGFRRAEKAPSAGYVRELLQNHQFTEGFSLLNHNTPTNNLEGAKSGYSSGEEYDALGTFSNMVKGIPLRLTEAVTDQPADYHETLWSYLSENYSDAERPSLRALWETIPEVHRGEVWPKSYAELLAEGVGFDLEDFRHVINADHRESTLGYLLQKATWFALGGQMLRMLFGNEMRNEDHLTLWSFYGKSVRGRGPYPAIKIGDLPYGVLPVTEHRRSLLDSDIPTNGSPQERRDQILAWLFEDWLATARQTVPSMANENSGENPDQELLQVLSMQPGTTSYQLRVLALERFFGRIPGWLRNYVETPESLYAYPPQVIHDLLDGKPGYNRDFKEAENAFSQINKLIGRHVTDLEALRNATVFSVKNADIIEVGSEEPAFDIPLARDTDWYKTTYLQFIREMLPGESSGLIWYDEAPSVVQDLLLNSYINAVHLFYREIFFEPKKDDIDGYTSYRVTRIARPNDVVQQGETVLVLTGTPADKRRKERTIQIKAPFKGVVEKLHLNAGDIVGDDLRLFRLKDESGYKAMSQEMASLGAHIILELERLKAAGHNVVEAQIEALRDVLDVNSYRLDAWLTGVAMDRLATLRKKNPDGFYFGAYGWVEGLTSNVTPLVVDHRAPSPYEKFVDPYDLEGGIIHCPTPAQAVAAAMFRHSFSTYKQQKKGDPFTLNLTSDRIQKGSRFMEGIRQGQEIEALLGYRFERFLRDRDQTALIYDLRKKYPLKVDKQEGEEEVALPDLMVVNGLQLIREYVGNNPVVIEGIDYIADILDGSADLMLFEAGYQMTQGNFSQAAAAMDAVKGTIDPPEPEAIRTAIPGIGVSNKLVLMFEPPPAKVVTLASNPRAFLEPTLEQWLACMIGPLNSIGCQVEVFDAESGEKIASYGVSLAELKIGYQDFLRIGEVPLLDGDTELVQRIKRVVAMKFDSIQIGEDELPAIPAEARYVFDAPTVGEQQSLHDALEICAGIKALLRESRALNGEDLFTVEEGEGLAFDESWIQETRQKLNQCLADLRNEEASLDRLAHYAVESARSHLVYPDSGALERSRMEAIAKSEKIEGMLSGWDDLSEASARVRLLQEAAHVLFGGPFRLIPAFIPSAMFKETLFVEQSAYVGDTTTTLPGGLRGGQDRLRHWLYGRAEVSASSDAFCEFLLTAESWFPEDQLDLAHHQYLSKWEFAVAQHTENGVCPWVELGLSEIEYLAASKIKEPYPSDAESIVVFMPGGLTAKVLRWYGLLVDTFTDFIPARERTTGVAFQYNAPNAEAPQAILLAVPPTMDQDWDEEILKDIIYDTMDLAKVRLVDLDAMKGFGAVLPMSVWFNEPTLT